MKTKNLYTYFFKSTAFLLFYGLSFGTSAQNVIISQIYAGGGTGGATYNTSYVQLFNLSPVPANINGWSLQWGTGNGAGGFTVIALPNVTIPGFQGFLITGKTFPKGAPIPGPNFSSSNFQIATAGGKIALVNNTTPLAGNTCVTNVVDFFGYGGANCAIGTKFPALTNTSAAIRQSMVNVSNSLSYVSFPPIPFSIPFNTLPITLIHFSVSQSAHANDVKWEANMNGRASFDVQRSENGTEFYTIKTVSSNIKGQQNFTYSDNSTFASKQYYRLKLTDESNVITYSNIIVVENPNLLSGKALLFPTLTAANLNLELSSSQPKLIAYSILSYDGRIILTGTFNCNSNKNNFQLDVSKLNSGVYFLSLRDQRDFQQVLRFIKQ